MKAGERTGRGLILAVYRIDADGRHHGEPQIAAGVKAPPSSAAVPCPCRSCSADAEASR